MMTHATRARATAERAVKRCSVCFGVSHDIRTCFPKWGHSGSKALLQGVLKYEPWMLQSEHGHTLSCRYLCDAEEAEDHELAEDEEGHKACAAACVSTL
jgi:hypothetical protein